ncbi:MAG: hypothetical protein GXO39_01335 [Thermotogae bacterium]|nr:hypothetical protein [Thermotogota bacterium]
MRNLFLAVALLSFVIGCKKEEETAYTDTHALVGTGDQAYRSDCLECHKEYSYAGTVWDSIGGSPIANVKVVIKAVGGSDSLVLETDSFGNFYTDATLSSEEFEAYVDCGLVRRMPMNPTYGGCNECHRPGGSASSVLTCR